MSTGDPKKFLEFLPLPASGLSRSARSFQSASPGTPFLRQSFFFSFRCATGANNGG